MADVFSKKKRSDVMSKIKSKDTKPELIVRSALHKKGFRFRLHDKSLPGKPDIVLRKYKTVIHVRGCFWHGHSCIDGHIPKSRRNYWKPKIERNIERDKKNDKELRKLGWQVITVRECKLTSKKKTSNEILRITKFLKEN